jgi:hypothetical protein
MYLGASERVYRARVGVFTPGLNFIKACGLASRHPHFQVPHYKNKKKATYQLMEIDQSNVVGGHFRFF